MRASTTALRENAFAFRLKINKEIQIVKFNNYVSIRLTSINFIKFNLNNFSNKNKALNN